MKKSFTSLASTVTPITLAVDSEYEQAETLTIQFAVRRGDEIRVQVYHSPNISPPQSNWYGGRFSNQFQPHATRVKVLPAKPITAHLSPARVLADLFGLEPPEYLTRAEGRQATAERLRRSHTRRRGEESEPGDGTIDILLTAHFLRADIPRAFGRAFWEQLLLPGDDGPTGVALRDSRVLGLTGAGAEQFQPVTVEYVRHETATIPVRLKTFDTNAAFGHGKLDAFARYYLGLAKSGDLSEADKAAMGAVFRARPREAYLYAVTDAVLALLLTERMHALHRDVCRDLGFSPEQTPPCHPTPGLRVGAILLRDVGRRLGGATSLGSPAAAQPAAAGRVQDLAVAGGGEALGQWAVSRFGPQTGQTHGGLLFNRSPTVLFHHAPGQFRDLDLASCYPAILKKMNVYVGRPVVWEPGNHETTLGDVAPFLEDHAAGWDAWMVKVTGPISTAPNALIPSTDDALTHANYKKRVARRRAAIARGRDHGRKAYTSLYTDEVAGGVVVWATWKMIQALPPDLRREYEALRVETVLFYPQAFVADSGPAFDALRAARATDRPFDWAQHLDLAGRTRTTIDDLDEKFVAFRYPIGDLADTLVRLRQQAAHRDGKGSGMDLALKLVANTAYGALACPHLASQNVVAANVITGTARALAFAMTQALNAHNVITDGVLYRPDQVPAGKFHDCLRAHPDYPIRRPEAGGVFLAPTGVPTDDHAFTAWYVRHVQRFFGVSGADYDFLFGLHQVAHKEIPATGETAFDGLLLDGSSNYAKLVTTAGGLKVADFKARGFKGEAKKALGAWLLDVLASDAYPGPPPPAETTDLLGVADAVAECKRALRDPGGRPAGEMYLPVGLPRSRVLTYKVIKSSQFLFRTARQKAKIEREWDRLIRKTACGPEILAFRPTGGGSVRAMAEKIDALIRAGKDRLNGLNIARRLKNPAGPGPSHLAEVEEMRAALGTRLPARIRIVGVPKPPTGLTLTADSLARLMIVAVG